MFHYFLKLKVIIIYCGGHACHSVYGYQRTTLIFPSDFTWILGIGFKILDIWVKCLTLSASSLSPPPRLFLGPASGYASQPGLELLYSSGWFQSQISLLTSVSPVLGILACYSNLGCNFTYNSLTWTCSDSLEILRTLIFFKLVISFCNYLASA